MVLALGLQAESARADQRNVLLIIADDIGVDKIEPYVYHFNHTARSDDNINVWGVTAVGTDAFSGTVLYGIDDMTPCTPTIRALSESGVMFLNAWGCPTCSPARASIITGTFPFRHGVYNPGNSDLFNDTDYDPVTLAEAVGDAGYATALFGKWHLAGHNADELEDAGEGPVADANGWDFHQGFLGGDIDDYYSWRKVTSDGTTDTFEDYDGTTDDYSSTVIVSDAVTWIGDQTGPWFATVAFNAAHWASPDLDGDGDGDETLDNQAPPSGCGCHSVSVATDDASVYRATVECMDEKIAELLAGIAAIDESELENTTIIFIGDNGTDHEMSTHFPDGKDKGDLFEGGVCVPLIIADGYSYLHNGEESSTSSGVGRIENPRRKSTALVQGVDLFATIADITGGNTDCAADSISLIPLLDNTDASVRDTCFAQTSTTSWAVRGTTYKLIQIGGSQMLFNLANDRWEQNDLLDAAHGGVSDWEDSIIDNLTGRKDDIVGSDSGAGCDVNEP